ncbi:WD repeat-containing protein 76-like [Mangifera indica]|uniref:WD repeat-containing protein 76-like n=1 Tax=Mangifera indica TaxID=29780 RepID=UPI001CFA6D16|nr:WD repeat-containing protein 76-like [Mangifera indica]
MASEQLTEYERKRLQNIKRNDEVLASLKILSKASDLSAAVKRQKIETKSYKISPQKKLKSETPVVIRRSLRTRGMPPDCNGLSDDFVDSDKKTTMSFSLQVSSSPDKNGSLSFKDAYTDRSWSDSDRPLIDAILSVAKKHSGGSIDEKSDSILDIEMKPPVPDSIKPECDENFGEIFYSGSLVKDFDRYKACEDQDLNRKHGTCSSDVIKSVVKKENIELGNNVDLGSLTLKPNNIARLMPGKILVVKFFPSNDMRMVMAGNKYGNIGFWNLNPIQEEEDGTYLYHPHSSPISGIVAQQSCLSKIFTSCYDGFIQLMDVEKEVFDLIHSSEYCIYSLSQQPNNANTLYFSEGQGGLNIWDVRTKKSLTECHLHEARINTIDFNSQNHSIMATSSSDGTACLWDLRSMNSHKPNPLKIASHKKAVHAAYFSPSGSSLATTSSDDTVGIWTGVNFEEGSMIHHNNQTGRWISSFRAVWGWDDSHVFTGNMKRGVDVISPAQRRTIMSLQSPHMSAIPCRFHAHPYELGMLAGATGGGQVYVWTSSQESAEE